MPAVDFAIETFGNARTLFNPNTFGLGKYTELQFTDRGRLRDKHTRLLFRAETELRPCLLVNATSTYSTTSSQMHHRRRDSIYICRKRCNIDTSASARPNSVRDDDTPVRELALKTIGLSERHVAQVCQLIAVVFHLGNLEFTIERSRDVGSAVVRNTDILALVADSLGVQPSVLGNALSYKTNCTVFLDPDDLAMTLYSLLFAWLDEYISQRLCRRL